jgi:lipoprotein signal peptidase
VEEGLKAGLILTAALLAIDLATKYLAYFLLRGGRIQRLGSGLSFELLLNGTGSNALLDRLGSGDGAFFVTLSIFYSIVALTAILLNGIGASRLAKASSYAVLFIAYAVVIEAVGGLALSLPAWLVSAARFSGGLFFGITFLVLTKERACRLAWCLFVAGGLGNFLCTVLPPFAVIDFINLPRLPRAAELYFNLADLYVGLFWPSLIVSGLAGRILALRKARRPRQAAAGQGAEDGTAGEATH